MADGAKKRAMTRARRLGGPAGSTRFSMALVRRIAARLESGETMRGICRDPDMPNRSTVAHWRRVLPRVDQALAHARLLSGWSGLGGRPPLWNRQLGEVVCARVAAGETLSDICEDREMPSLSVVYRWRASRADFRQSMTLARQVQAERLFDMALKLALDIPPKEAYARHVTLTHLRWTAAALSPARFGRVAVVEPEAVAEAPVARTTIMRHFDVETRPDGWHRVVAFGIEDGRLVRETPDDEPWSPPPPGMWMSRSDQARLAGRVGAGAEGG